MKKIVILFTVFLILSLAACTAKGNSKAGNNAVLKNTTDSKILIVYFSHSGTTEVVANMIQQQTQGNIFKIETVEPYPENENQLAQQVEQERNNNYLPALSTKIENFDSYNTIFIGYPIWQGFFPQAIAAFLEEYDFSGKTLVPFCTCGSTGLGNTVARIEELTSDATVLSGLAVLSSNANNSQKPVTNWLTQLGIIK